MGAGPAMGRLALHLIREIPQCTRSALRRASRLCDHARRSRSSPYRGIVDGSHSGRIYVAARPLRVRRRAIRIGEAWGLAGARECSSLALECVAHKHADAACAPVDQ